MPGAARPLDRDELSRLDREVDVEHRVDDRGPARERLAHAAELVLAHSTVLSASAGRRRAARSAAAAPASSPPRTASEKPSSRIPVPVGAVSETVCELVRVTAPMPKMPSVPVVELAVSVGPNASIRPAASSPRATPAMPPRMPGRERLAGDLAHDAALRPAERLQRPQLAHALPNGGERQQRREREGSRGGDDRERDAQVVGEVRRVDERAADLVGDLLRARHVRRGELRLDPVLGRAHGRAVVGAHEHDVDQVLLAGKLLQLAQREVDVRPLAAERRVDQADDREARAVQVQLGADLQRLAGGVRGGDERLAAGAEEATLVDLRGRDEADRGVAGLHAADRVRLARDVRLRRVEHLLQGLTRGRDRRAELLHALWQALGERAAAARSDEEAAGARFATACAEAARLIARRRGAAVLLDAGLDLVELRLGRRLDPARDVDAVAAGLDLGHDLRHFALLVHGLEQQARRDRAHLAERGDLLSLALGERELRAGEEEVVDEVVAGLAELGEVGHYGAVRLDEVPAGAGEHPLLGHLAGDGQVGADPGEWVERRLLRALEPVREARDRDHETDAEREPGERDDRPSLAPDQLGAEVAQVEHGRS